MSGCSAFHMKGQQEHHSDSARKFVPTLTRPTKHQKRRIAAGTIYKMGVECSIQMPKKKLPRDTTRIRRPHQ